VTRKEHTRHRDCGSKTGWRRSRWQSLRSSDSLLHLHGSLCTLSVVAAAICSREPARSLEVFRGWIWWCPAQRWAWRCIGWGCERRVTISACSVAHIMPSARRNTKVTAPFRQLTSDSATNNWSALRQKGLPSYQAAHLARLARLYLSVSAQVVTAHDERANKAPQKPRC
jgi:hypothetical protein